MKINDVVHGCITISEPYSLNIINTEVFQCLKFLKQQGHTYIIYSNAIHNRLSHTLGVYHNIQSMLKNTVLNDYEQQVALCAALLHDIGHGPFSHAFEEVTGIHHEDISILIIRHNQEIRQALNDNEVLIDDIINVISRNGKFPIIERMMFSELGADKLDYLARDYYHSNFFESNIDVLNIIAMTEYKKDNVIVKKELIPELEKLYTIKNIMFNNGFCSKRVIEKDVLLKMIFNRLLSEDIPSITYESAISIFLKESNIKSINIEDYIIFTDQYILNTINKYAELCHDKVFKSLCSQYLSGLLSNLPVSTNILTAQVVNLSMKYGKYNGGIQTVDNGNIIDISDISPILYEHTQLPAYKKLVLFGTSDNH